MKQASFSSNRKQYGKITLCLFMVLWSLVWDLSLAEPETVNGLLADNINHQTTSNQALKTQKKQYPLKGKAADQANQVKNKTSKTKLQKFQAQKHQKLLNAIQENSFPRLITKQNKEKQRQAAIQNVLAANNKRIRNKLTSDVAARNINFLNERARPLQNPGQPLTGNTLNENGVLQPENKVKSYPSLHPDTIGRISYRGKNGQASMAFGKYLQDHPIQRQQPWKNFPSLFPPRFPQSSSYQSLAPANQLPAAEFLQRQFNLPNNAYNGNIKGGQSSVGQYWDGKNTLMKDGSSTPNGEIQKHKWPVQSTIKGVKNNLVDLNSNKKTNMEEKNVLTEASNPNRDMKPLNKQLPETKVSDQMKQDLRQNIKETTLVEDEENATPQTGQNLNQVPDIANTEKSDNIQQPSSPSSGPIWGPPSTSNTVKMNGEEIPKIEMLKADKKAFDFEYDAQYAPRESISALVIGLTFVAIFIVMAFGLVAHTVYTKLNGNGDCDAKKRYFGGRGGFIRSPNEEDRTPPELRSGCGQASFVQPELGNSMNGGYGGMRNGIPNGGNVDQNGTNHPFFNGKLILHELNSNTSMQSRYPMNGINTQIPPMTTHSGSKYLGLGKPGEHLGAIPKKMPSPAANVQVTDDLISPKFDDKDNNEQRDDTTESEEEDDSSDDTVYECPGLAASSGEEIVVANPFFMPGQNFTPLVPRQNSPAPKAPQPITKNETIFHQGIAGFN